MARIKDICNRVEYCRLLHNSLVMLVVRDLLLELFKPPPGVEKWQFCQQAVKGGFGDLISAMYVRQFSRQQIHNYKSKVKVKHFLIDYD